MVDSPDFRLYQLLQKENPREAYPQYNALIRRLISFEQDLERQQWAKVRAGSESRGSGADDF